MRTVPGDQIFKENSALQGGAIFCTFCKYFTMYGHQKFINNSAAEGGAIYSFANHLLKFEGEQVFETDSVYKEGVQYQVMIAYGPCWGINSSSTTKLSMVVQWHSKGALP